MFLWPSSHRKSARILSPGRCRRYTCRFSFSFFFFFLRTTSSNERVPPPGSSTYPPGRVGNFWKFALVSRSKRGDENLNGANSFLWNECKYWLLTWVWIFVYVSSNCYFRNWLRVCRTAEIIRFKYILEDWSFFCGTNLYLFSIIIRSVKLLSTFRDPFKCTRVLGSVSSRRFCRRMKNKTAE